SALASAARCRPGPSLVARVRSRRPPGLNLTILICDQELGAAQHHWAIVGGRPGFRKSSARRGTKGSACLMYLAKFFHRPPGNDDRELLLIPESACGGGDRPLIVGIVLSNPEREFIHKEYPSMADANRAFRAAARDLRRDGYVETVHTDYTLRSLLPDP